MNSSLYDHDERQVERMKRQPVAPPETPEQILARQQFLGLRPTKPYVPTPLKPLKRRRRAR